MIDWAPICYRLASEYGLTFEEMAELTPWQVRILLSAGKPTVVEGLDMNQALRIAERQLRRPQA